MEYNISTLLYEGKNINSPSYKGEFTLHDNKHCIFLLNFGYVKDLKNIFNLNHYNDNDNVIQYGITISNQLIEYINNLIKLFNNKTFKIYYSYIFFDYLIYADKEIKSLMNIFNINNNISDNKFIVMNDTIFKIIQNNYNEIIDKYSKIPNKFCKRINKLNDEKNIIESKYKLELEDKEKELFFEKINKELHIDILNKNIEVMNNIILELENNNKKLSKEFEDICYEYHNLYKKYYELNNEINNKINNNLLDELTINFI